MQQHTKLLKMASDWGLNETTTSNVTDNVDARCTIQSCRVCGFQKYQYAACFRVQQVASSDVLPIKVVLKYNLHPLPGKEHVACTKLHHIKAAMELSGGGEDQAEGVRKGNWESDGIEDSNDPNTSMRILLDWWMTEGSSSKFCGKNNNGVIKIQFCNSIATKILEATTGSQHAKTVLN